MIGGIGNNTTEDEREERESKRERKKKKKREKETGERERERGPPCVRSKRSRVYRQHAHMFYTCGHVAGTHRDILNAHTGTC